MTERLSARLSLLVLLGASACTFQSAVPASVQVDCGQDGGSSACPVGFTCQAALGRCVATSALLQPSVGVAASSIQLSPAIGNLQTTFQLQFQTTRALALPPSVYASRFSLNGSGGRVTIYPFTCSPCSDDLSCSCLFRPDPTAPPSDGSLQVSIEVIDEAGNAPPPISGGTFELDTTPPALVPPTTLNITPGPGIDTPVSEVGPLGGAEVCFAVDEVLGAEPTVWGAPTLDAPPDLFLTLESNLGTGYCFELTRDGGGLPDGPRSLYANAVDLAGNATTLTLVDATLDGGLVLDGTPPPVPDFSDDGGLRYRRAPWGELPDSPGIPAFSVSGTGAGAIAKPGWLIVSADQAEQIELARVPVAAGPLPLTALVPQDWPETWVDLVDLAGNRLTGGAVRIPNVDWVANLGRKQAGSVTDNPNSCHARPVAGPSLIQPDDAVDEVGAPQPDGGADQVQAQPTWRQRIPAGPPVDPGSFSYDSARGRTVAYTTTQFVTFEYDGVDWLPTNPVGVVPSDRNGAAMSYDSLRGRSLLFGGYDVYSSAQLNFCDTWDWDGTQWEQISNCRTSTAPAPPSRYHACLTYDPQRSTTLLVDGLDDYSNDIGDQWQWDGTQWTNLVEQPPDGGTPFAGISCYYQSMAYLDLDGGQTGEMVALGTTVPGGVSVPDDVDTAPFADGGYFVTWLGTWTGSTYAWKAGQLISGWTVPLEVAADPVHGELAALIAPPGLDPTQIWRWDGVDPAGWQVAATVPTLPAATGQSEVTILWGGPTDEVYPFRLIYWAVIGTDQVTYTFRCSLHASSPEQGCIPDHHPAVDPGLLSISGFNFDSRGRALMVGTPLVDAGPDLGVWIWDGNDWSLGPTGPSSQFAPITYQPDDGRFWLFSGSLPDGGVLEDFWVLDLDAGWTELPTDVQGDPSLYDLVIVLDAGWDRAVLGLGASPNPSLRLDLTSEGPVTSTVLASAPPGAPEYDPVRGKMIMACIGNSGDVAEGDPPDFATWPVVAGGLLINCSTVWDASSQEMLTLGGESLVAPPVPGDVAVWDGTSLTHLPLADAESDGNPQSPYGPYSDFDPVRQTVVEITDLGASGFQTWEMSLATVRPDLVCHFQFGAAQAGAGAVVTGLQVQASASSSARGATFSAPPVAQPTRMVIWDDVHWMQVAQCDATACPSTLGSISYQTSDPVLLAHLVRDMNIIGVGIGPEGPGTGKGSAAVRDPQVVVSYRLPP